MAPDSLIPEWSQLNDKPVKSDREGYFKVIISDLLPDKIYPVVFRWEYEDGSFSPYSNVKSIITPSEEALAAPEFLSTHLKSDGSNFIVTWSGKDKNGNTYAANFKEIEVWYKTTDQGGFLPYSNKITKASEPLAIPASQNQTYQVKLKAVSTSGVKSEFSDTQTILIDAEANDPISNVVVTWSGGNLNFTITHDLTLPNNKSLDHYRLKVNYPGYEPFEKDFIKNAGQTTHTGSFLELENKNRFGTPLKTNLSGFVYTVAKGGSPKNPYPWTAPSKVSTLPAPVISLSKGIGYYRVSWTAPSSTLDDKVAVIVIEESSSSGGPWSVVAKSSSNPVDIQSNSSTKYVRAIYYDTNDLTGQGYSTIYSVTPDPVIVEDNTVPAAPSSVSISANSLSSYELKNGVGSLNISWTLSDISTYTKHGGVNIEYKLTTDSGYNSIFVPFTTASPKYSYKLENLIQGLSYNVRVSSVNGNTLKQSSFTTSSPTSISVLSSTSISKPKTPEVFVGTDSTNTNAGPLTARVRQYSQKSDSTDIEKDINYFEVWAIPSTYTSANDSVAQKIGTLKAAASGGNMNYVEGNFTVNAQANTTYKFYTKAINNGGYASTASDLSTAKSIPFMSNAYISDLSADKITTGTLAATQSITIGTGTNSIKINSDSSDTSTYIRSGTGGYNDTNSGFYVDASGRFSLKNKLTFDGTDLNVTGNIKATSGTIESGNLQVTTGTIIAGTIGGNRVVMNSSGISSFYNGSEVTRIVANPTAPVTTFYTSSAELGGTGSGSGGWIVSSGQIKRNNVVLDAANSAIYTTNQSNTFYAGIASPTSANDLLFWAGGPPSNKTSGLTFGVYSNGKVQIGALSDAESTINGKVSAAQVNANVTEIDGSVIKTGTIKSWSYSGVFDGSSFATNGTAIRLGDSVTAAAITSKNFRIDTNGNAFLKGEITASAGRIGGDSGWSIGNQIITSNDGNTFLYNPTTGEGNSTIVLQIGSSSAFSVTKSGTLTATNVDLSGTIKATNGYIGGTSSGWLIGTNTLSNGTVFMDASTGVISGAKLQGGSLEITGGFLLGDDGNEGVISAAFTTIYSRKMPVTSPDYPIRNAISSLGVNAIAIISQDSGGWVSHNYPYWGGAADLGVIKYWWRHGRFGGNVHVGYANSNTLSNTSTSDAVTQSKIFLDKDGPIYANTLGTVSNTTTAVQGALYQNTAGYIKVFLNTSSIRYKENVNTYSSVNYENIINGMRIVTFNYKPEYTESPNDLNIGLIAEEVAQVEPSEFLIGYKNGQPEKVYYSNLPFYILGAVQEISAKIKSLETRLDALES